MWDLQQRPIPQEGLNYSYCSHKWVLGRSIMCFYVSALIQNGNGNFQNVHTLKKMMQTQPNHSLDFLLYRRLTYTRQSTKKIVWLANLWNKIILIINTQNTFKTLHLLLWKPFFELQMMWPVYADVPVKVFVNRLKFASFTSKQNDYNSTASTDWFVLYTYYQKHFSIARLIFWHHDIVT